ncbi:MAG: hypothetical protein IT285_02530 [Bdellovibrionales bacterium]|nr:hypothetical protein [Bdellovibrionales bacterium]
MKKLLLPSILTALCLPGSAQAGPGGSYSNQIPVSSGVSHPSYNANSGAQNPAGLAFNRGSRVHADVASSTTSFSDPEFGGDFLFGGGTWGGGLGVDARPADAGTMLVGTYGLAAHFQGLSTVFGLGGRTGLSNVEGTEVNLGLLVGPYSRMSIGFVAYGLVGGVDGYGAGLDFDLGRTAAFTVDVTTGTGLDGFLFKPGLWVGSQKLGLTVSYGFSVGDGPAPGPLGGEEVSIGLNLLLGRTMNWQLMYQSIDKLYTGLTFDL